MPSRSSVSVMFLLLILGGCERDNAKNGEESDLLLQVVGDQATNSVRLALSGPLLLEPPTEGRQATGYATSGDLKGIRVWFEPTGEPNRQDERFLALVNDQFPATSGETVVHISSRVSFRVELKGWEQLDPEAVWQGSGKPLVEEQIMAPGEYKLSIRVGG